MRARQCAPGTVGSLSRAETVRRTAAETLGETSCGFKRPAGVVVSIPSFQGDEADTDDRQLVDQENQISKVPPEWSSRQHTSVQPGDAARFEADRATDASLISGVRDAVIADDASGGRLPPERIRSARVRPTVGWLCWLDARRRGA
jgi:hypothetical protein